MSFDSILHFISNLIQKFHLSRIPAKLIYLLVNYIDLWLMLVFFTVALASWRTAVIYRKIPLTQRDAAFAAKTAMGYVVSALVLWVASFILS
ncbi:hypothetical protein [Acetonema longum]|uniref:Uncharacterized protein n=1 Tax=Acetonema longum DSM 6540 TaxID=1009370 RepID=F7NH70_9FIRM|nr:hypothetical protein [Acetonema longum]EGO64553.1 hypothetical protein ALO_07078 [Acetonema longum DSM 6540]